MVGMMFGSYVFGWVSDSYGRIKALLLAVVTLSLSGTLGLDLHELYFNVCLVENPTILVLSVLG
jgi:MFS family permease